MNDLKEIMHMETAIVEQSHIRAATFKICYLTGIAVAMVGWLSAFGFGHRRGCEVAVGLV